MRWTKPRIQDLMHRLAEIYPDARCALDHADPFQLVVATILSAQCTDARVNLTTPALFARYPDAAALAAAQPAELEALIHATGFFRNKARNLIGLGQALLARHSGQVPGTFEALSALPGVGQKTANVVLANAFGVPALAVDTHIFRVGRRLGLSEGNTPEKVEADLCRHFARDLWIPLHHQLIWHGRRCCHAQRPDCDGCALRDLCPTGNGRMADPHTGHQRAADSSPIPAPSPTLTLPSADSPQRIVSLVPSVTECLARWGLADRLVGRSRFCIEPRWIRNTVPALGGTKDPDLEAIRTQRPDLVILERSENTKLAAETLQAWGIPLEVLEIDSAAAAHAALLSLSKKLGVAEAGKAEAATLKPLLRPQRKKGLRTLILVWREPWISAGPGTYPADVARLAGFTALGEAGYPTWSEAELNAAAPEVILLPDEPFPWKAKHRQELQRRFPSARILAMDGKALNWYLSRSAEGIATLRDLR